jgi:hypothetical protein
MSYDLIIYSPSAERVWKENLRATLQRQGWEIAFISEELVSDQTTASGKALKRAFLAAEGPLEKDIVIVGWKSGYENAALLSQAVAAQEVETLEAIAKITQAVGGCSVYVAAPYQTDMEALAQFEEMDKKEKTAYAEVMKLAQSHYYLRTSSGRSGLSLEFQRLVWLCIGQLCGGFLEDMQVGKYFILDASQPAV